MLACVNVCKVVLPTIKEKSQGAGLVVNCGEKARGLQWYYTGDDYVSVLV